MSHPAVLFAPLGVGYDGSRVDLDAPQAGWVLAGSTARAEIRSVYSAKKYRARAGEGSGVRRILNGPENVTFVAGFHEQDFDLFGLIYGMNKVGGGASSGPHVYVHRLGAVAEFSALAVQDYDNEAGGLDQVVWYLPHLVATTGLSVDMSQAPAIFDLEADALAETVGMPDGSQIYSTHTIYHFT